MRTLGVLFAALVATEGGAQDPAPQAPMGSIEGTVYDSLLVRGPVRGATVYVIGTTRVATSDVRGRFRLDSVPHGEHQVTFSHAVFDSAGVQAPIVNVTVGGVAPAQVAIATPTSGSLLKTVCPAPREDKTGLLLGVVRDVDTGSPLRDARVVSRWFELTIDRRGPRYQTLEAVATTDDAGVYRLCGVPSDIPIFVRARSGTQESGRVEIYFSGNDVAFRDFGVSLADTAARMATDSLLDASSDSAALFARRGLSTARGIVRDMNGKPLANTRVGTLDNGASVLTNSEGQYVLTGAPAGTQTLELRALGYQPLRRAVTLKTNGVTDVDATRLDRAAQKLASISVTGTRKDGRLTKFGFDDRRRRSNGFFMDAEEIEKKSGIYLGDVLRFAPGLTPVYTSRGRSFLMRSTSTGDKCTPTYYLDGMRWHALEGSSILELERFITLRDVAAVEVYSSAAGMPMQFDTGSGCGAVAFWTK